MSYPGPCVSAESAGRLQPSRPLLVFLAAMVICLITTGTATQIGRPLGSRVSAASPIAAQPMKPDDLIKRIASGYPQLRPLYERLHSHPELSFQEEQTAARLAHELAGTGFKITPNFGGYGLVAELQNGPGPTVLVRTEMDALPIEEKTGLSYASKERTRDSHGNEVGVMHACGHDVHMTCWVGTARLLAQIKDRWHGTLLFVAQPAEETGDGADMMLQAGLYQKFHKPDYCLALHCSSTLEAGHIAYTKGLAMANVDTVGITVRGRGGHGALPHMTVDPIVIACRLVLDLQTLVSRENNPTDPLVVTVGSFHGGTKSNVIPDEVQLQLTVRSLTDASRKHVLEGIARIARAAAMAADAPEPLLRIHPASFTPALLNDSALVEKTVTVFRETLGADHIHEQPPRMLGEDFAAFARDKVPIFLYFLGTQTAERISAVNGEHGRPLPSLHSDEFFPAEEPTIKTGVLTMTKAVLNLLGTQASSHGTSAASTLDDREP